MTDSPLHHGIGRDLPWAGGITRSDADMLHRLVIIGGIGWSIVFIVIGLRYELQLYGDGAIFSYSVAVQDAWAFHWHNISGRLAVFLFSLLPAEACVGLTGDPSGGIIVYGLLFFMAPLLGLIATFAADRSRGHIIFDYACFSTACLCPLVFGFPTEMWLAHALFWPTLAAGHYTERNLRGNTLVVVLLVALILTHEAALVLAAAIVVTLLLRGINDPLFRRGAAALLFALAVWAAVKLVFPPGGYFANVFMRAALDFFDLNIFTSNVILLLLAAIVGYCIILLIFTRLARTSAHIYATSIVTVALVAYWTFADHGLHAADRYYLRTILVIVTPLLAGTATAQSLRAGGRQIAPIPGLARIMTLLSSDASARTVAGAFVLVMLVHAVETAKFVTAWMDYKAAVAALATGVASDPSLGDSNFVSSDRIGADRNRLSWFSTTPYLSVIVAKFVPTRLVVDPRANNYFWLSCETATANLKADRAVPVGARSLVRINACLHR